MSHTGIPCLIYYIQRKAVRNKWYKPSVVCWLLWLVAGLLIYSKQYKLSAFFFFFYSSKIFLLHVCMIFFLSVLDFILHSLAWWNVMMFLVSDGGSFKYLHFPGGTYKKEWDSPPEPKHLDSQWVPSWQYIPYLLIVLLSPAQSSALQTIGPVISTDTTHQLEFFMHAPQFSMHACFPWGHVWISSLCIKSFTTQLWHSLLSQSREGVNHDISSLKKWNLCQAKCGN